MKEYPESNYILRIWELRGQQQPEVAKFLPGGWLLTINYIASVTFLPYLPATPWPPPPAADLDVAHDPDEAARVVMSTSTQLVTPTNGPERIEELTGEIPEKQTVFWVTPKRYTELDTEIRALIERPYRGVSLRLLDLGNSPLRAFLESDFPQSAALSNYEREILCLKP